VGIWGAHQVWPREGRIRRHPLVLSYGPTLSPGGSPSEEALLGELREEVIRLVDESSRAHDEASLN